MPRGYRRASPATKLWAVVCAGLAVALAFTAWATPEPASHTVRQPAATPVVSPIDAAKAQLALPALAAFAETTARPLFLATRTAAPQREDGTGPVRAAGRLILGRYRLTGVVITPARRSVVLTPVRGGRSRELVRGQDIDGWTLEAVAPDSIVLRSGEVRETISLGKGHR